MRRALSYAINGALILAVWAGPVWVLFPEVAKPEQAQKPCNSPECVKFERQDHMHWIGVAGDDSIVDLVYAHRIMARLKSEQQGTRVCFHAGLCEQFIEYVLYSEGDEVARFDDLAAAKAYAEKFVTGSQPCGVN